MKGLYSIAFLFLLFATTAHCQTEVTDSILHDGIYRSYIVHFPPNYTPTTELPTAFILHGGSQDGQKILDDHFFDEVADTGEYILVCPDGLYESWADGRGTTDADLAGVDDVGFLNALADTLIANFAIDDNKLYIGGGSNGGFMTQRMACLSPDKFAAFATVISSLSDSLGVICSTTRPTNMLVMNSTDDGWVPYEGGQMGGASAGGAIVGADSTVNFWLAHNNILNDPDSLTFPDIVTTDNSIVKLFTYPVGVSNTEVVFYKVIGAGHTVPGQLPNWNQIPFLGYVNRDIGGAEEIWNFFLRHCNSDILNVPEPTQVVPEVFPNPATESITIRSELGIEKITLIDLNGKQVLNQKGYQEKEHQLDLESIVPGMYILQVDAAQLKLLIR